MLSVDNDAHHGDDVEAALAERDGVLTISLHERGRSLYPVAGDEWSVVSRQSPVASRQWSVPRSSCCRLMTSIVRIHRSAALEN